MLRKPSFSIGCRTAAVLFTCLAASSGPALAADNVIVVVLDDVSVDELSIYQGWPLAGKCGASSCCNNICTAQGEPLACCTGAGTGTCTDTCTGDCDCTPLETCANRTCSGTQTACIDDNDCTAPTVCRGMCSVSTATCATNDDCNFPKTPFIDALAEGGVVFRNAYADPFCPPTRGTIQTGRYGFRTGVFGSAGLGPRELTIPKVLDNAATGYATAAIGKWHISSDNQCGLCGPVEVAGYDFFAGSDVITAYCQWGRAVIQTDQNTFPFSCPSSTSRFYATTQNVDDAIRWILDLTPAIDAANPNNTTCEGSENFYNSPASQNCPEPNCGNATCEPGETHCTCPTDCPIELPLDCQAPAQCEPRDKFFLYLAFNAPHDPHHAPLPCAPGECQQVFVSNQPTACGEYTGEHKKTGFRRMLEIADCELSRLNQTLNLLTDTTFIVVGDNGTSALISRWPTGHEKGSVSRRQGERYSGRDPQETSRPGEPAVRPAATTQRQRHRRRCRRSERPEVHRWRATAMSVTKGMCIPLAVFGILAPVLRGDEVLFRYEGDVHPSENGFSTFNPCDPARMCSEFVENGALVIEWDTLGDIVNYDTRITERPAPALPSIWVEWRFRSNYPLPSNVDDCDGRVRVQFDGIVEPAHPTGDAVVSFSGDDFITGLTLNEFYTLRFQSADGLNFIYSVDGLIFVADSDDGSASLLDDTVQFGGIASCNRPPGTIIRNEWDFIRYGTLSTGEAITASHPPSGLIDAQTYPNLDRLTVTFDEPAFVYVDEVMVTVIGEGSPTTPQVLWVKRPDNSEPDTVEIVLDQSIPLNTTTTFTFGTGGDPNTVAYTYVQFGACCFADGACEESDSASCTATFIQGGACEGDADADGFDGLCGDSCPMDSSKLAPGQCGCGNPDTDSDFDTIADCLDQCHGEDDRIDADQNGTPDCAQFQPIPTASTWGLGILALLLLIAGKIASRKPSSLNKGGVRGVVFAALFLLCASSAHAARHYVKPTGTGNCSTWTAACSLPTALTAAASGDEIWVQAGTYAPFALKNGVKIIGGFAGTETLASQSNPASNATTVDGGGNSQCVTGNGDAATTVLRGFTIRNCAVTGTDLIGAGIYLEESSAKIVNCTFENNLAQFFGAAAAVKGTASPEFINCTFRNNGDGATTNAEPYAGGGVWIDSGSPKFVNCLFHDNKAGEGGAIACRDGSATLVNCTVFRNHAEFGSGGGLFDVEGKSTVHNSILWGNTTARQGPQIYNGTYWTTTVTYSDVEGGWTGTGNINTDPTFVNAATNDFKLAQSSLCRDAGNNSALPTDAGDLDWDGVTSENLPRDLANQVRTFNSTVDLGAYESFYIGGGPGGGEG